MVINFGKYDFILSSHENEKIELTGMFSKIHNSKHLMMFTEFKIHIETLPKKCQRKFSCTSSRYRVHV